MRKLIPVSLLVLATPGAALAQHDHAHSPYAGLAVDAQATIPAEEASQLRRGEGMGLALVAELNRYPGPKHVIELAGELGLSEEQAAEVAVVQEAMTANAVAKGEEVLAAEARLTTRFRSGEITPQELSELTTHIGTLRGQLRAIHLQAHLETRQLLTDEQIEAYHHHRGYTGR